MAERQSFTSEHVFVTKDAFPQSSTLYEFDKGYMRGSYMNTPEGKHVIMFGVSNVMAQSTSSDYRKAEKEEVTPVCGLVFTNSAEIRAFGEFLVRVADYIDKKSN